MMRKRIFSALVGLPILGFLVWYGGLPFLIFCVGLIIVSLFEFYDMLRSKGIRTLRITGVICAIVLCLCAYWGKTEYMNASLTFILILFLSLQLLAREPRASVANLSNTLLGLLYIGWLFSYLIVLRKLPMGKECLFTLLLITWIGDSGAYIIGTKWGRRKLIPRISPKKSIEGAGGGLVFSLLAALLTRWFFVIPLASKWFNPLDLSITHYVVLGLLLGAVGQVGDLAESLLKRDANVKDSSRIIPGHGGLLDVIDSLLFTAPVMYYYTIYVIERLKLF
jgi:phosphatidate cytidylyltransferase